MPGFELLNKSNITTS